jgi:shikimate kinase
MPSTQRIFLTGFMGSGKSHTGERLAGLLGLPFIDLDAEIEGRTGQTITDIFAGRGEAAFRELERDTLHEVAGQTDAFVLSTGGGAPCFHDNMRWMNEQGTTVFLDPPLSVLLGRLEAGREHRPLLQNTDELATFVTQKLAFRRPDYEKAKIQLCLADPTADVARLLATWLQ